MVVDKPKKSKPQFNHNKKKSKLSSFLLILKSLRPSLITGAADNDPSAITNYSQAGTKFGFSLLWLVIFLYPFITVMVGICARIGIVTGSGLTSVICKKYSKIVAFPIVVLLIVGNVINISADIGAMSASIKLIFPQIPLIGFSIFFSIIIMSSIILISYKKYARILRYLTLTLLVYFITAIIVGGNWSEIFLFSAIPHIELTPEFMMMIVAIFGNALSPYMLFWQTSEESEENIVKNKLKEMGLGKPRLSKKEITLVKVDVAIGMAFAVFVMWSIMVTTGGSLHTNEVSEIQTADQAAQALEPLVKTFPHSGEIAKIIFVTGIIGTGLLAIPVFAGTCGYALSELFEWKEGLSKKFNQATPFYLIITMCIIIGLIINYINSISPIQMLLYAATINGIILVPILIIIMKIANDTKILGNRVNGFLSNILGWTITVIIFGSVITFLFLKFL
jgi:Mn2+/Fe2+ NRAMP family transporter